MMKELIRLFRQFLTEKKEERLKANLIKNWCKDENYEAAAELFKIFTDSNSDVVMEIDVPSKFKIRIFRDVEGKVREERLTEDELFLGRRG